jgi:thymidylate synthase
MLFMNRVADIRDYFAALYSEGNFVADKTGKSVLEIIGASFTVDETSIFGAVNQDYVERELAWYKSQSLYVCDIPGGAPQIWQQVACRNGRINSNYGNLIWSIENGEQYSHVLAELRKNRDSRRAIMIYTRPSIWVDYSENGRSDFICTNAVQYLIRDDKLHVVVQMRSNDAWAGFRNDLAWQQYVQRQLATELGVAPGDIHWNAGSLHLYSSQFYLVDHYIKTKETHITKSEYTALYGS